MPFSLVHQNPIHLTDRPGQWAQQSIIHNIWLLSNQIGKTWSYRFRVNLDKIGTPKWLGPVEQSVVSLIADTGIVRSIRAQYFRGGWSWNILYRHSPSFSDSRRDIVSYKRKRVHKVLPSLSLPQKSVVRFTDHLDMAMTIDLDFKPKTKVSQNSSRGHLYLYSIV